MKELINERVFKPISELDAEIRTIKEEKEEEGTYFNVEVGLCESIGEMGYNYTFFMINTPKNMK